MTTVFSKKYGTITSTVHNACQTVTPRRRKGFMNYSQSFLTPYIHQFQYALNQKKILVVFKTHRVFELNFFVKYEMMWSHLDRRMLNVDEWFCNNDCTSTTLARPVRPYFSAVSCPLNYLFESINDSYNDNNSTFIKRNTSHGNS